MKITKNQLKQIIKEELSSVMSEEKAFWEHDLALSSVIDDALEADPNMDMMKMKQNVMAWIGQYAAGSIDSSVKLNDEDKNRLYQAGLLYAKEVMR